METFADILESTDDFDRDVRLIVHETMYHHGKVIFNGNGYSEKWVEEAERRGLPNISNSVDAAKAFIMDKSIELFQRYGIFTPKECESRYEIMLENYIKTISTVSYTHLCGCIPKLIFFRVINGLPNSPQTGCLSHFPVNWGKQQSG